MPLDLFSTNVVEKGDAIRKTLDLRLYQSLCTKHMQHVRVHTIHHMKLFLRSKSLGPVSRLSIVNR